MLKTTLRNSKQLVPTIILSDSSGKMYALKIFSSIFQLINWIDVVKTLISLPPSNVITFFSLDEIKDGFSDMKTLFNINPEHPLSINPLRVETAWASGTIPRYSKRGEKPNNWKNIYY